MAVVSAARRALTYRSIRREVQAGRDVAFWLDKAYSHLDSGMLAAGQVEEIEALAMAYYDALDAAEAEPVIEPEEPADGEPVTEPEQAVEPEQAPEEPPADEQAEA